MVKKVVRRRAREDNSGIFIPAGALLGLGYGAMTGNWAAGVLTGLGLGFLVMAIVKVFGK
ncbi:hypothetical protein HN903_01275 [archaeon]|jgi:hypothetical protein|nr:hypothetical protein [archaeon]MBT7128363.1 hypothetical protein [archaeon]